MSEMPPMNDIDAEEMLLVFGKEISQRLDRLVDSLDFVRTHLNDPEQGPELRALFAEELAKLEKLGVKF